MNDRELLEKAARAAGINLIYSDGKPHIAHHDFTSTPCEEWNPLEDDGDLLRLMIKLQIEIQYYCEGEYITAGINDHKNHRQLLTGERSENAKICILRAAALLDNAH